MATPETSSQEKQEDPEECAWCKYMKGGPCKTVFEVWQACVDNVMPDSSDDSKQAAVSNCEAVTRPLFECMMKNPEYYGPQLAGMVPDSKEEGSSSSSSSASASTSSNSSGQAQASPATAAPAPAAGADRAAAPTAAAAAAEPPSRVLGHPVPGLHAATAASPSEPSR